MEAGGGNDIFYVSNAGDQVLASSGHNKVYAGTTAATIDVTSAALVGVLPGDTVTLSTAGATGAFLTKDAGNNVPITVSGLSLGGAHGDTRLEATDYREVVRIVITVRIELKGNVDIRRLLECNIETRTHHANDFIGLTAQHHPFPDHLGIASEAPLPEPVGEHCGLRRPR